MKVIEGTTEVGEEIFTEDSDFHELKEKYKGGLVIIIPAFLCVPKKDLGKVSAFLADEVRNGRCLVLPEKGRLAQRKVVFGLAHPGIEGQQKALEALGKLLPEFS